MFSARGQMICAAAGIAGPAVFTGAWIVSSLRQTGYLPTELQISGLAAPDARDPWIMMAGFVVLGGCTVAFGVALDHAHGGRGRGRYGRGPGSRGRSAPAPALIKAAGVLTVAAGLLRRDHMLLMPGPVSWHNHAHDAVSAVIYADLVLAQALLAAGFGRAPGWRPWARWLAASSAVTAAVLVPFAADTSAPWAGILQRIAVTVPLAAMTAVAARLVRRARTGCPAGRGQGQAAELVRPVRRSD